MALKQEDRWQDRLVTYGGLLRVFLIGAVMIFLIVGAVAILVLNVGGKFWSASSGSLLALLGLLIPFLQRFLPALASPPSSLISSPGKQAYGMLLRREENILQNNDHIAAATGTLIVSAAEKHYNEVVYLLPRHVWNRTGNDCNARDTHREKVHAIVTRRPFNIYSIHNYSIHVAVFRNLKEGEYVAWIGYRKEKPGNCKVEVFSGEISVLERDWLN